MGYDQPRLCKRLFPDRYAWYLSLPLSFRLRSLRHFYVSLIEGVRFLLTHKPFTEHQAIASPVSTG